MGGPDSGEVLNRFSSVGGGVEGGGVVEKKTAVSWREKKRARGTLKAVGTEDATEQGGGTVTFKKKVCTTKVQCRNLPLKGKGKKEGRSSRGGAVHPG